MARAKGYNPVMMWGGWLGALLGLIPLLLFLTTDSSFKGLAILPIMFITVIGVIVGFLIGYGIHYSIRKSGNRKKMAKMRSLKKKKRKKKREK